MSDIVKILKGLPNQTKEGLVWLNHPDAAHQYPYYEKIFTEFAPKTIVEIGTYLGYSLATAALNNHNLERIDFIDNESYLKGSNQLAIENIRSVNDYIDIQPWNNCGEATISKGPDLIHIDGGHDYDSCLSDLKFAMKLRPKVIIGHDCLLKEYRVREAVRDFCDEQQLRHIVLPEFTHGLYLISWGWFIEYAEKLTFMGLGEVNLVPPKWL